MSKKKTVKWEAEIHLAQEGLETGIPPLRYGACSCKDNELLLRFLQCVFIETEVVPACAHICTSEWMLLDRPSAMNSSIGPPWWCIFSVVLTVNSESFKATGTFPTQGGGFALCRAASDKLESSANENAQGPAKMANALGYAATSVRKCMVPITSKNMLLSLHKVGPATVRVVTEGLWSQFPPTPEYAAEVLPIKLLIKPIFSGKCTTLCAVLGSLSTSMLQINPENRRTVLFFTKSWPTCEEPDHWHCFPHETLLLGWNLVPVLQIVPFSMLIEEFALAQSKPRFVIHRKRLKQHHRSRRKKLRNPRNGPSTTKLGCKTLLVCCPPLMHSLTCCFDLPTSCKG